MDKKKLLTASLASVAVLGLAFATSQPLVVKAEEETTAQKDFLANYDKALEEAVKALEAAKTNSPEEAKAKADTIAALKAASDATRKEIVEGFKKGLTVEAAEKLINQANEKAAEEDKAAAAKEKAAQEEFLANYDQALKDAIAELEKADTKNDPELEKQKKETVAALKAASVQTRSEIVEGFKQGLTAKQAEGLIDEANKKAAEEDKEAAAKEEAAQEEFLANYDAALKAAIAELEKAETNSPEEAKAKADTIAALKAASDKTRAEIVEGFKQGLTAKQAEKFIDELNKKAAEEDKAKEKPAETPVKPSVPARPANPIYVPSYVPSYSSYSVVEPAKPASPKTGWKQENGMWYFYNTDGSMATGWLKDGDTWYYLNANGAMATGWLKDGGTWYYLNSNGAMATGWLKDGGTWYYLENSGAMKASQWFEVGGTWYYVDGSGALAVNTTVNGYTVNGNGEWI